MCVAFLSKSLLLITLYLANFVTGDPVFIKVPINKTAYVGEDIVIEWNYTVSDRNTKFRSFSPVWNYYDKDDAKFELASEVKSDNWKWKITQGTCPKRLLLPVQRIYKLNPLEHSASLNITNVSLADSGRYECQLQVSFFPAVTSDMYLNVKVRTPTGTTREPSITKAPESKYTTNSEVSLDCGADGEPKPIISWTINGRKSNTLGSPLKLNTKENAGVCICTATNTAGNMSSVPAIIQYTRCDSGCQSVIIRFNMTDLTFTSEYENKNSPTYKNLTRKIEIECFQLFYSKNAIQIYSCSVQSFRRGSVVAEVKITHPDEVKNPGQLLKDAIRKGKFADQAVRLCCNDQNNDENGGGNENGGLSKGAIAGISVAVIIVVAGIVALIVWRVKKKKDERKGLRIPMS